MWMLDVSTMLMDSYNISVVANNSVDGITININAFTKVTHIGYPVFLTLSPENSMSGFGYGHRHL